MPEVVEIDIVDGVDCVFVAEVGDYCDELAEQSYLSTLKLLPSQTPELDYKIMEHHREHMYVTCCL